MSLLSPLRINKKSQRLSHAKQDKRAIDRFIELIINTPQGECVSDPEFGFIFANMRFEIFNESEGVVQSPNDGSSRDDIYQKKISGTSNNLNTFASELSRALERYETRLSQITVTMSYAREERLIRVKILGVIKATEESYQYLTTIRVWS